ncbi:MAG TPA: sensor histidine kinase [Actinocrinis sp.]|nr:sensor histidine kinase [Actinocrinis sp.]
MSTADSEDGTWLRPVVWIWHGSYLFALLMSVLIVGADGAPWPVFPLLGVLGFGYLAFMVPALAEGSVGAQGEGPGRGWWFGSRLRPAFLRAGGGDPMGYVYLAIPVTLALGYLDPTALIMLYVLLPQIMGMVSGMRLRIGLILGLCVAVVVVSVAHDHWSVVNLGVYVGNVIAALAISIAIGGAIRLLIGESERRGALIRQLRQARAGLDEAQHQAGVHQERERLAREIHDTLAQGFTSILMLVQAADADLGADPETVADPQALRRRLALAEQTARQNLAEARALVAALAPADLDALPLDAALGRITSRCGEELGIQARATVTGPSRPLPAGVQVVVLRGAQEALANVRKHAAARRVEVRLEYRAAGVLLEVSDDGCGFEVGAGGSFGGDVEAGGVVDGGRGNGASSAGTGYGLRGLRARVEQVSGTVHIDSSPGAGTTVRLELP